MIVRSNSLIRDQARSMSFERQQSFAALRDSEERVQIFGKWLVDKEMLGELLIGASLIFFGLSFVCQKQAMINGMKPISYNAFRYLFSTIFLGGYLGFTQTSPVHDGTPSSSDDVEQAYQNVACPRLNLNSVKRLLLMWGGLLAVANLGGSIGQQIGLVTVTAGKTGFITGMYVIFVPIVEFFFPSFHTKLHWSSLAAALVSLLGLYLLSGCAEQEKCFGGAIREGEVVVFLSMLFWVASIMFSDLASKQLDGVWIVFVEFSITTVLTLLIAVYFEPSEWVYPFVHAQENWDMIVIVGLTEAMAFGLSTLGQTYSSPSRAALLFSLEAIVCAVLAFFFLGETLTWIEVVGALLMFLAALGSSLVAEADEEEETEKQLELSDDRTPILSHPKGFGSLDTK